MDDYAQVNRMHWDGRAAAHAASAGYDVDRLVRGERHLSGVVAFDRPRLGDVRGLDGLHLQCHIGTDTLSLSRLGARMTGLDISPASLREARQIAHAAGEDITYVEAQAYDAADVLGTARFDFIYTGIGAICWLPDIARWAAVVRALLRPGGMLFMREGHPMLFAIDEVRAEADGSISAAYPYFETADPVVDESEGTYVDTPTPLAASRSMSWNHGIGEVVTALMEQGMALEVLEEHDSVPWEPFRGRMERVGDGEWRLADRPIRLAHSYSVRARVPHG